MARGSEPGSGRGGNPASDDTPGPAASGSWRWRDEPAAASPRGSAAAGPYAERGGSDPSGETEYRRPRAPVRVRRARWRDALAFLRHWRRLVTVAIAVAAVLVGGERLFRSSWFVLADSDQIEVSGAHQVTRAQVVGVFGADLGRNVFFIPLAQRRRSLESIAWVRDAAVLRLWPARLEVRIEERVPAAYARTGAGLALIDAGGVLLDLPAPPAGTSAGSYDFPVLTGLAGAAGDDRNTPVAVAQRRGQMSLYLNLRDQLAAPGAPGLAGISEVDLHDPADLQAMVIAPGGGPPVLVHFGDRNFATRYRLFLAHIAEWRATYPGLAWVELQFDGQAIVDTGTVAPAAVPAATAPPAHGHAPGRTPAANGAGKTPATGRGRSMRF